MFEPRWRNSLKAGISVPEALTMDESVFLMPEFSQLCRKTAISSVFFVASTRSHPLIFGIGCNFEDPISKKKSDSKKTFNNRYQSLWHCKTACASQISSASYTIADKNKFCRWTGTIEPVMISSRQSTETIAIEDSDLLAAVRFIRENACGGINVQEVADSVPIGRRSLERKFREHFGRTPLDEIQRLRLGRVCELLIRTDLAISQIASDAGFGTPEYMTTMFKSKFGLTPLRFRSRTRAR